MNLLELVEKAGIVGCGGAGFPAHVKWNAKADYFIVNAVECEPLLGTDKYLMRHRSDDLILASTKVSEILGAKKTVIALKETSVEEIRCLERAIKDAGADIEIYEMKSFYPAGDEHVIVYEVTGKTVPCGGIPLDVGAVVSNVATLVAASDAVNGKALTDKYVTVAGEVKNPSLVKAPVGTSVSECIEAAGGTTIDDYLIIAGGPLMGMEISSLSEDEKRVEKTTSGILVLPKNSFMEKYKEAIDLPALKKKAAAACIQCNYCTMLCPRQLLGHPLEPHRIMRAIAYSDNPDLLFKESRVILNASLCTLCGVCTAYACPMGLQPSKVNEYLKEELAKAGMRRSEKEVPTPQSDREWRKIPTGRITSRIGVNKYAKAVKDELVEVKPAEILIKLKQGIGQSPEPCVQVGDKVEAGMMIASIPEGAMGSNLHSGIEGEVVEVSEKIRIRR